MAYNIPKSQLDFIIPEASYDLLGGDYLTAPTKKLRSPKKQTYTLADAGVPLDGASAAAIPAAQAAKKAGGLKGWFANAKAKLNDPNTSLFSKGPNINGIKDFRTNLLNKPIWEGGPKVSTGANVANLAIQGIQAGKGLYDNSQLDADYNDLKSDINAEVVSNPMYDMYLTPADEQLLRKLQNGTAENGWNGVGEGVLKGIPNALLGASMGGLVGGIPGAIIGGVGSLVNSGISGYGSETAENTTELQGLYDRLRQANEEYRSMKRPRGLRTAGLSSKYYNELY